MGPEIEALDQKIRLLKFADDPRNARAFLGDTMDSLGAVRVGLQYGAPYYFAPPICDMIKSRAADLKLPWKLTREVVTAPQGFFWFTKPVSEFYFAPLGQGGDQPVKDIESRAVGVLAAEAKDLDDGGNPIKGAKRVVGDDSLPLRAFSWTIFYADLDSLGVDPVTGYAEADDLGAGRFEVHGRNGIGLLRIPQGGGSIENATGIILQFYSEFGPGRIRPSGYTVWRFGRSQLDIALDEHERLGNEAGIADPFRYGGMDNAALATAFQFIQQKILVAAKAAPPDRHARKRLEKEAPDIESAVRVIQLRRRESMGYVPPDDHKEVAWSVQWYVDSYWRMSQCMNPHLHQEGTCTHQAVIVAPHWKGPESAPIKPPKLTLYKVAD